MIPIRVPVGAARGSAGDCGDWHPGHHGLSWALFGFLAAVVIGVALLAVLEGGVWGPWFVFPFLFWPLFPLGFIFLFFLLFVVFRVAWWGSRGPWGYGGYGPPRPREILKERYARGEISADQLRQMARDLDEVDHR